MKLSIKNSYDIHKKSVVSKVIAYTIMISFTILTIGPLFWMFYTSFKSHGEIVNSALGLPKKIVFFNYAKAWIQGNFTILSVNSIIYSTVTTIVTIIFATSAGYALAKFEFKKVSGFLYTFFLIGILITTQSVLVPLFLLEKQLGILNTYWGVFLPYIAFALPMAIYLATTYIKGIPDSFEEAAIMDGAGYLRIYSSIILPICSPIIATIAILSFIGSWNEFAFVFMLTSKDAIRSLPVGLQNMFGGVNSDFGLQAAALVIATLPMLIFYIFFNKKITKGFGGTNLKG